MSLLTLIKAQFGKSNTAANNFVLDASADNGSLKLARGNAGATTQDILTVDANGNVLVDSNNLNLFSAKSLTPSGYQKLPSGLIIQWGQAAITGGASYTTITYPIAFPNAVFSVVGTSYGNAAAGIESFESASITTTNFQGLIINSANAGINGNIRWIAIGY